jgi:hypothetical protein
MLRKMSAALSFILLASVLCFAEDLNGRWEGKVKGPDGDDMAIAFTFKIDGDKLTGTVESPMGELPITEGTVKGDEISFSVKLGDDTITHQGKLVGDTLTIKAHGPWGDMEFPLKRAAAKKP